MGGREPRENHRAADSARVARVERHQGAAGHAVEQAARQRRLRERGNDGRNVAHRNAPANGAHQSGSSRIQVQRVKVAGGLPTGVSRQESSVGHVAAIGVDVEVYQGVGRVQGQARNAARRVQRTGVWRNLSGQNAQRFVDVVERGGRAAREAVGVSRGTNAGRGRRVGVGGGVGQLRVGTRQRAGVGVEAQVCAVGAHHPDAVHGGVEVEANVVGSTAQFLADGRAHGGGHARAQVNGVHLGVDASGGGVVAQTKQLPGVGAKIGAHQRLAGSEAGDGNGRINEVWRARKERNQAVVSGHAHQLLPAGGRCCAVNAKRDVADEHARHSAGNERSVAGGQVQVVESRAGTSGIRHGQQHTLGARGGVGVNVKVGLARGGQQRAAAVRNLHTGHQHAVIGRALDVERRAALVDVVQRGRSRSKEAVGVGHRAHRRVVGRRCRKLEGQVRTSNRAGVGIKADVGVVAARHPDAVHGGVEIKPNALGGPTQGQSLSRAY